MSIKEALDKQMNSDKIYMESRDYFINFTQSEMQELFGTDFEALMIKAYNEYRHYVLFEDNHTYYWANVFFSRDFYDDAADENEKYYSIKLEMKNAPLYREVNKKFLDYIQKKREFYEKQLNGINKVLDHPKYRLQNLFQ
jgi:hypothetical protein